MDLRIAALLTVLTVAGCSQPDNAVVQVLVGGALEGVPVENPVVVIEKGRIAAIGSQTHQPIPRGSAKTDTTGFRIRAAEGGTLTPGAPADLDLLDESGAVVRRMRSGEWQ